MKMLKNVYGIIKVFFFSFHDELENSKRETSHTAISTTENIYNLVNYTSRIRISCEVKTLGIILLV